MLKRLLTLALFIGLAIPLHAQGNTVTLPSSGAPSSLGCNFNLFVNDNTNGNLYFCKSGTLTILNGSGGSGNVVGPASSTTNHLAVFGDTTGKLLADGGVVPTGIPTLPTTPNSVPQIITSTPSGGIGQAAVWALPGLVNRALTGAASTDTILATDQQVVYQQSGALAETLPTATTLAIPNFVVRLSVAAGSGTVTVTPTTWTINGASTLVIRPTQSCIVSVDAAGGAWDAACSNPAPYTALANATTSSLTALASLFLATPGGSAATAATIIPFGNTGTVTFSYCGVPTAPGTGHTVIFTLVQSTTFASTSPSDTSAVCTISGTNTTGVVSGSYAATVGTYWEVRATLSSLGTTTAGVAWGLQLTNY